MLKRHISIEVFVVYIDTGSLVLYIPSKSRDLADENNKILTEWKWFESTVSNHRWLKLLNMTNTFQYFPLPLNKTIIKFSIKFFTWNLTGNTNLSITFDIHGNLSFHWILKIWLYDVINIFYSCRKEGILIIKKTIPQLQKLLNAGSDPIYF